MSANVTQAFENMLNKYREVWQENDQLAYELYASLCNIQWAHKDHEDVYACSWRYAGDLVAGLRSKGEQYIDFYCSGGEGCVTEGIMIIMIEEGWFPVSYDEEPIEIIPELPHPEPITAEQLE